jgi:hypothetical protein
MKKKVKSFLVNCATVLLCSCGKEPAPPPPAKSTSPKAVEAAPTLGGDPNIRWSEGLTDVPQYPDTAEYRNWKHPEIAQRHRALIMKELPGYITQLRGNGAIKETDGTSAAWYFRVPQENLPDWENYMKQIGVPEHALHGDVFNPPPYDPNTERRKLPPVAASALVFCISSVATGEGDIMEMHFGKSVKSVTYSLYNPNVLRASIRIKVAWKTGDVQILEYPVRPDWE